MGLLTLPSWLSFHVFYHGDRVRMARLLVRPLLIELAKDGLFSNFFFIRYSLGGPHLRLRFEPAPDRSGELRTRALDAVRDFLDAEFSTESLDAATIRRVNEEILANDDTDDHRAFVDNSVEEMPFEAEVQRYGGRARLDLSLRLFGLSSLAALDFIDQHHHLPQQRQLPAALAVLMRQAVGLARDAHELDAISRYGADWSPAYAPLLQRGDATFKRNGEAFTQMLRFALAATQVEPSPADLLRRGSQALARAIEPASGAVRHEIKTSHLHMTANRLGLSNTDEAYIGRILTRSVEALRQDDPEAFESSGIEAPTAASGDTAAELEAAWRLGLERIAPAPRAIAAG